MTERQYQSKLAQKLYQLYQEWDPKLGDISTMGMRAIFYKSSREMLLIFLQRIDEDEELREKIRNFLIELVEAKSDDTIVESR